jgi:hypothetical protein
VRRVEVVALFWHPPFGSDTDLRMTSPGDDAPAGYLVQSRNP